MIAPMFSVQFEHMWFADQIVSMYVMVLDLQFISCYFADGLVRACVRACVCGWVGVCVRVYMCVCMFVCLYVCM